MESILPNRLIQALTSSKRKHPSSIAPVQPPPASSASKSSQPVSTGLRELPPHLACKTQRSGLSTHVSSHSGTNSTGTYADPPGRRTAALAHGLLHADPDAHLHRGDAGLWLPDPAQTLKFFPLKSHTAPAPTLGSQHLWTVASARKALPHLPFPGSISAVSAAGGRPSWTCLRPHPACPDNPGQCHPEWTRPACPPTPPPGAGPPPRVSRAKSHQQLGG